MKTQHAFPVPTSTPPIRTVVHFGYREINTVPVIPKVSVRWKRLLHSPYLAGMTSLIALLRVRFDTYSLIEVFLRGFLRIPRSLGYCGVLP
jgi:hypothetical protein